MSKGFFYKWSDKQTVNRVDQVIGRLALPSGNYIILGEASVAATKLNGTVDFNQSLECRLKAGTVEDKVMLNLWSDGFRGNWGVIALNIGVKFDGGTAELTCTAGNPGCILVFDVAVSAIQVDELQISEEDPSAHHKPSWYTKIQEQSIMRIKAAASGLFGSQRSLLRGH
jgi:hypothetical protein